MINLVLSKNAKRILLENPKAFPIRNSYQRKTLEILEKQRKEEEEKKKLTIGYMCEDALGNLIRNQPFSKSARHVIKNVLPHFQDMEIFKDIVEDNYEESIFFLPYVKPLKVQWKLFVFTPIKSSPWAFANYLYFN